MSTTTTPGLPEDNRIQNIVILGGGTAGWMSAALLHAGLHRQATITLIESAAIPTVGVGEGSVPSIQPEFFDILGIAEEEWMRACNATFKLGIKFVHWAEPPDRAGGDTFYHIFGEAHLCDGIPLTHYWIRKRLHGYAPSLSHACYTTPHLCDAERAPKFLDGRAATPYAYHFDAGRLAVFLRQWAIARGVQRVEDEVVDVCLDEQGNITALVTQGGGVLQGDLFIDCSGFTALLIKKTLGEPFISYQDSLLCDRAVALQTPYCDGEKATLPYTTATARSAGWTWRIPLTHRYGNGYVYSSSFLTPEQAERELRQSLGPPAQHLPARHVPMRVGRMRRQWVNNCVSIGLAAGFLEPLESTGIYAIYAALFQLLRYFPRKRINPVLRDKFNERTAFMMDDIKDFIVLHYCTTSRTDTPFWRANREELVIPDSLQEDLALYKAGVPIKLPYTGSENYNCLIFDTGFDRFWSNSNYTAILSGMHILPEREASLLAFRAKSVEQAEQIFRTIREATTALLEALPAHAAYVARLQSGERGGGRHDVCGLVPS